MSDNELLLLVAAVPALVGAVLAIYEIVSGLIKSDLKESKRMKGLLNEIT